MMPPDADPHIWKQAFGPLSRDLTARRDGGEND